MVMWTRYAVLFPNSPGHRTIVDPSEGGNNSIKRKVDDTRKFDAITHVPLDAVKLIFDSGVNLGYLTNNGDHVAWFSGLPKSDYTDIGPDNVNPCTRTFDLKQSDGGTTGTYQEFGCGTSDYGINKNGAYYAQCTSFSEPDADVPSEVKAASGNRAYQWYCALKLTAATLPETLEPGSDDAAVTLVSPR
ncbi:hypothetical protein B0H11DRAFT_2436575 [Mycena galericulata]|nr:hypothetical protein B0H11DRAFT_2436575 [Mycena galericulata]